MTTLNVQDEMDRVYDALVHWADAILVSTPIRWGAASSLYFKMAERLNALRTKSRFTIACSCTSIFSANDDKFKN